MRILETLRADGPTVVKLATCDCDPPVWWAFAQRHRGDVPARDSLWLTIGTVPDDEAAELRSQCEFICRDVPEADDVLPSEVIDRGVALVGLPLTALLEVRVARDQFEAMLGVEGWLLRLPAEYVWQTRRLVFGAELSRVPRALHALDGYYRPEYPVRKADLLPEVDR